MVPRRTWQARATWLSELALTGQLRTLIACRIVTRWHQSHVSARCHITPVSSTDQRNTSLIGEHLVSSIGRCWGGSVLGGGQEDDLGYARGRGAGQAHRQASGTTELVVAEVHRRCRREASDVLGNGLSFGCRSRSVRRSLGVWPLGWSFRLIARGMGRSASTICREVNVNGGRAKYRALPADRAAQRRALRPKRAKLAQCRRLRSVVERKLEARWSPEQISGWLAEQYPNDPEMRVSHETIYQSLFVQSRGRCSKELHACLRTGRAMRRAKAYTKGGVGQGQLRDMVMISERPAEVADRAVPGHWEGDLIFGKKMTSIGTLGRASQPLRDLVETPQRS